MALKNWLKRLCVCLILTGIPTGLTAQSLEEFFLNPDDSRKPMIIWQWMDGLVTKEGITKDLEAFKAAGLSGVQNFQIGGPDQMMIGDPENAIGSEKWKSLLKWTLEECERLGLTFGTHNCPGWSSSAYITVKPEYSMQKLVYSEIPLKKKSGKLLLPKPKIDPTWDYYEDIAVFAVPSDSICEVENIINLTQFFDRSSGILALNKGIDLKGSDRILRIGQTTNGKTNEAQAPESGRGLECDKLSREALKHFWEGYPSMVLEVVGRHTGKTFTHFEIDSYEAGGQVWSPVLPDEFFKRNGYEIIPFLPYMAGRIKEIGDKEITDKFRRDWEETVRSCVAENYYGYMNELCGREGIKLMIEPYGTGGQKPFMLIDFYKIAKAAENADIATEFWQAPDRWGWRDMVKHEAAVRRLKKPILIAEAFTCWPLSAWSDSPETLKPMCDKAFCYGVNKMMLHAGAANPWPDVEPGMSFGKWGTQFVPGQTWWKAGGAKELFDYMSRCQALLQQGLPAENQLPEMKHLKSYRRRDDLKDTDIIFICNPSAGEVTDTVDFNPGDRSVELWDPYTKEMFKVANNGKLSVVLEPYGSRFLVVRPGESTKPDMRIIRPLAETAVEGKWRMDFPGAKEILTDSLFSWPDSDEDDLKYYSGTVKYMLDFNFEKNESTSSDIHYFLSLGDVKNMAKVTVNNLELPILWKSPFECDVTEMLNNGKNTLEVYVTNLWPNRMIGDEQEPDDLEWSDPLVYSYAKPPVSVGSYLKSNPDWLRNGTPRPSKNRKTVGCFKFFTKDSPLLPSGLLGPVTIKECTLTVE